MCQRSRSLPKELREIVEGVLTRNFHWATFENILLCMLGDNREEIRQKAVTIITKIRARGPAKIIRQMTKPPKIIFTAKDYTELIH